MPGIFTGNGSVEWVVEADNVREASSILIPPGKDKRRRVRQRGVDETDPDEYLTVSIKVPRDRDDGNKFIAELIERARKLKLGQTLTLRLPIEDKRRNGGKPTARQIVVAWPSAKAGAASS